MKSTPFDVPPPVWTVTAPLLAQVRPINIDDLLAIKRVGSPRLSPDGRRMAVMRIDPEARSGDIWVYDVARGTGSRLTFDPSVEEHPVWSPDGSRLLYSSNRAGVGDIYQKSATGAGAEDAIFKDENYKSPLDWSRDGRFVIFRTSTPTTRRCRGRSSR